MPPLAAPNRRPSPRARFKAPTGKILQSIFKVRARAVPNARSSATLGQEREGTGVVIGDDGLVVTVGYLIVEADEVSLVDPRAGCFPRAWSPTIMRRGWASCAPSFPFSAPPLPLGDSAKLADRDPVMIVNHAGVDDVTLAIRRVDAAVHRQLGIPARAGDLHVAANDELEGAALVNRDLQARRHRLPDRPGGVRRRRGELPGNMFVPIDALKPILPDLLRNRPARRPARPWLGVAADEVQGRLMVSRVSPEVALADQAGIKVGDIILGVGGDGVRTQAEFYRKVWGRGAAGTDIPLRVLQGVDVKELAGALDGSRRLLSSQDHVLTAFLERRPGAEGRAAMAPGQWASTANDP